MRQTKAKKLRRTAQLATIGLPDVEYLEVATNPTKLTQITRQLTPRCTRFHYQLLKGN